MPSNLTVRVTHSQLVRLIQKELATASIDQVLEVANIFNFALRESTTPSTDGKPVWVLEVAPTKGEGNGS